MAMSLAGIVFGVGFFIFSQAQTSGFEQFFINTILGTNGAIRVQDRITATYTTMELSDKDEGEEKSWLVENDEASIRVSGVENPLEVMDALNEFKSVSGTSQVLTGTVLATSNFNNQSGFIYGINIDNHISVSDLENQIIFGDIHQFKGKPNGVLLGSEFARRLGASVGDTLTLTAQLTSRRCVISGIFQTGVSDIDRNRIYLHLQEARSILQKPHGASFIQVNLVDPHRAPAEALQMRETLFYNVASWQQREKSWLDAFRVLRVSTALTVSTIILLSGLGMFNTLAMLVLEKTKEIAILRSMGYTRGDISSIFLWQGVIVLIAGTLLGSMFAVLLTYGVSKLPFRVSGIFTTDSFVVHWSIWHYIGAAITASIVVMVASYIPAQRAAKLEPGDIIRGTSQ